jgi:mRNA-degrading endonuclease RelE of RelBE toxin-antitoxin system
MTRLHRAWGFPALHVFYELDPNEAMRVDRAVIRFSETGQGEVARVPPYWRLHVGPFRVLFTVEGETMNVLYLYRAR